MAGLSSHGEDTEARCGVLPSGQPGRLCSCPSSLACSSSSRPSSAPPPRKAEKLGVGVLPLPEGTSEHTPGTEGDGDDGKEQSSRGSGSSSAPSQLLQEGKLRPTKKENNSPGITQLGLGSPCRVLSTPSSPILLGLWRPEKRTLPRDLKLRMGKLPRALRS